MNTLEDRIRAATRAAGSTVSPDSVPPLRLGAEPTVPARSPASARRRWGRRLAPLAAAAAVVAVAVSVVAISGTQRHAAGGSHFAAPVRAPAYYVALASNGSNPSSAPSYAVVRATKSGATIATIRPPGHRGTFVAVTAADDRTFVLDEQPFAGDGNQAFQARTFYLLRLGPSGSERSLTKLPAESQPSGSMVTGLALSPDGTRLAVAVQPHTVKSEPNLQQIRVYTLATGAVRTWSGNGTIGYNEDDSTALSWAADGRTLAFDWLGDNTKCDCTMRLLDLSAPGDNLLTDSRQATPTTMTSKIWNCQTEVMLTPDGQTLVCAAQAGGRLGFVEYSAATGRIVRILYEHTYGRVGGPVPLLMFTNASGSLLIAGFRSGHGTTTVGLISSGHLTPVPWPAHLWMYAAAW